MKDSIAVDFLQVKIHQDNIAALDGAFSCGDNFQSQIRCRAKIILVAKFHFRIQNFPQRRVHILITKLVHDRAGISLSGNGKGA